MQQQATSGHLAVRGQSLEYQISGDPAGTGPVLVLLHEGLGCVAMWRDFPQRLAEATGLPVLSYSRAGYGGSSPARLPRPLTYMHDEALDILPDLLREAGIGRAVLVGHSDGASIAAIHAGSERRAAIAGLVLMAPHFFVEDVSVQSIEAARQAYEATNLRERLKRYHGDNVDSAFLGWNGAWLDADFRRWDITEFLPNIQVPVLLIQGRDDEYGTLAQIETGERLIPGSTRSVILDDCGHAPHRDQPEKTLAALASFLQRLDS